MQLSQILEAIEKLDNSQFVELAGKLDAQRQKRAQQILNEANAQAALLGGAPAKRGVRNKLPPKYMNKATGQTWSGQGRQPRWFAEYLAKGGEEKELLI